MYRLRLNFHANFDKITAFGTKARGRRRRRRPVVRSTPYPYIIIRFTYLFGEEIVDFGKFRVLIHWGTCILYE